jgi:hypothetical protein
VDTPNRKHVGILVIHGMGNEDPYGPLDEFARGLYWHYRRIHSRSGQPPYQMQTDWRQRDSDDPAHLQSSWTQAQIRFERGPDADTTLPESITVAEYYWSPATKGKIKDLAVLTWLIRVALEPFRYLSENLQVIKEAAKGGRGPAATGTPQDTGGSILGREIFRLALIYPLLLLSFVATAAFLHHLPDLASLAISIPSHGPMLWWALSIVLRLLILFSLGGYLASWLRWLVRRYPNSSSARYTVGQVTAAVLFTALLFLVPVWMADVPAHPALPAQGWWHSPFILLLHSIARWIAQLLLLKEPFVDFAFPLAELALAATIRLFLIDFMGDVAIYTNLNQRTGYFNIRAQILEECGHALTTLYTDLENRVIALNLQAGAANPATFELVIAAHSLGTVIAYDTVNDHFNRARIGAPAAGPGIAPPALDICSHLRGLLTFGSPLNKVYYFFRDRSAPEALLRSQIVDGLHGFRLLVPDAELPGAPLAPVPEAPVLMALEWQFQWINVWAPLDPFCGKLFFYDLPEAMQLKRWYLIPILAHLSYWTDPQMYTFFAAQLLS